jgi:hypothetical protein
MSLLFKGVSRQGSVTAWHNSHHKGFIPSSSTLTFTTNLGPGIRPPESNESAGRNMRAYSGKPRGYRMVHVVPPIGLNVAGERHEIWLARPAGPPNCHTLRVQCEPSLAIGLLSSLQKFMTTDVHPASEHYYRYLLPSSGPAVLPY